MYKYLIVSITQSYHLKKYIVIGYFRKNFVSFQTLTKNSAHSFIIKIKKFQSHIYNINVQNIFYLCKN